MGQKIGYFGFVLTFFGPYWALFGFNVGLKNCFGVHSCSLTTFIFYDSLNSDKWISLKFGVVFVLWGPNGLVWGSEYGLTTVLRSTHVVEQLSSSLPPIHELQTKIIASKILVFYCFKNLANFSVSFPTIIDNLWQIEFLVSKFW